METTTTTRRNVDRFIAATGKSESDYNAWASEVGRKMHINKLDALVCAKLGIYTVAHLPHLPHLQTELPETITHAEVMDYMITMSQNPYELAMLWREAKANAEFWICKEAILAEHLSAFPKEDFFRWGDKNHIDGVARAWFHKEGVDLDVQMLEINNMEIWGEEITIQDAIEFVMKYRPGTFKNRAELQIKKIEDRFRVLTTFAIKDYYVDHLIRMCSAPLLNSEEAPF